MNLNKVFIIGRLTRDVELRATPSGQSVASFGVATNRIWTNQAGQKQEEVEYHNVVVWGRQAELANQYLAKGRMAMIEGRLRTRSWEDKTGQKRYRTEVVAERIQFGPKAFAGGQESLEKEAKKEEGKSELLEEINLEEEGGLISKSQGDLSEEPPF
jgi:single-strand DNA-binding protein